MKARQLKLPETGMQEDRATRLKRLQMRSMRRGIKEMDILLSAFAAANLEQMNEAQLYLYDQLLLENDQDLYQWISGQTPAPEAHVPLIADIRAIYDNYGFETEILAASGRTANHVKDAAMAGADVATIPPSTLKALASHPLTDKGLDAFLADWQKTGQSIT